MDGWMDGYVPNSSAENNMHATFQFGGTAYSSNATWVHVVLISLGRIWEPIQCHCSSRSAYSLAHVHLSLSLYTHTHHMSAYLFYIIYLFSSIFLNYFCHVISDKLNTCTHMNLKRTACMHCNTATRVHVFNMASYTIL
jgi:hypothetical protein